MSCETFTETIDGIDVSYTQLPAKKSLALKYRLLGLLGGAVSDIANSIGKKDDEQLEAFGKALQDVFGRNDPNEVLAIIEQTLKPVFINGERIDIDRDFTGNLELMYKILFWVLDKEYGNFIRGFGNLL